MTADADELAGLRTVADYQFGAGAGRVLFPPDEHLRIKHTTGGRPQQVFDPADDRLVSFGVDGRFTLGVAGGRRLAAALAPPACRVAVGSESEPFVRDGDNAFAKFVTGADPDVRAGDEVLVVGDDGTLFGVGRAELDAAAMADFETGMAVLVRDGAGEGDG